MTSKAIILLVLSAGGDNTEARILDAFAMQESTRAAKGIHVPGDNGKAWGIWQFHKARWKECGGDPDLWGKAEAKVQAKIMLNALRKYTRNSRWGNLTVEEKIIVAGRYHNRGHCKTSEKDKHYWYTKSVWKHYQDAQQPPETTKTTAGQQVYDRKTILQVGDKRCVGIVTHPLPKNFGFS